MLKGSTSKNFRSIYRRFVDRAMAGATTLAALMVIGMLFLVLSDLAVHGIRSLTFHTIIQGPTPMGTPGGGIRNAIVGTLILIGLASLIGLPLGILGGMYQIESKGPFANSVRFLTDVLNSVPSIVIGLFVNVIVVLPVARLFPGSGYSAAAGGVALGIIMVPTIMRTTEEMLRLVPIALRDASLALGASRWRTMFQITLPAARAGVVTGVMLALARVGGETAPLLFTAFGNVNFSVRIDKPIDALSLTIFYDATSPYPYLHRLAQAGALILIVLILLLSLATRLATRSKHLSGL